MWFNQIHFYSFIVILSCAYYIGTRRGEPSLESLARQARQKQSYWNWGDATTKGKITPKDCAVVGKWLANGVVEKAAGWWILDSHPIGDDGLAYLLNREAVTAGCYSALNRWDLLDVGLTPASCRILADAMLTSQFTKLRLLNLGLPGFKSNNKSNTFGDDGFITLLKGLEKCPNLVDVTLAGTGIGEKGVKALVDVLKQEPKVLKKLETISFVNGFTCDSLDELHDLLEERAATMEALKKAKKDKKKAVLS